MSLTETCLGLAIAASAMIVATPSLLRAREEYVLRSAAHDVATKMYAAKVAAITRNRDCRLRVTSNVAYVVECQGAIWETIETVALPRGITISANAKPEFHRRGNVAPAGTLTVWDSAGKSVRVVVNINGRVRIQ
jgi:Tfp pilus assembly protein FimT